jgi:hypothetical protein
VRTEAEIRRLAELLAWYAASGRISRQIGATQDNIVGVIAAIEYVLGDGPPNPVAGMIEDIREMRRLDAARSN